MQNKGISLVGIKTRAEIEKILDVFPNTSFELSYAMSEEFWSENKDLIIPHAVSIHSLSPMREYFPNFASNDKDTIEYSRKNLLLDAKLAKEINASILVLHPGYILPILMPSDYTRRSKILSSGALDKFISYKNNSICIPDYTEQKEYKNAFALMVDSLIAVDKELSNMGITLALENLNPRAGYMLMLPDEILYLARNTSLHFCIDIGHLWISACRFGFDFLASLSAMLETGRVVTTHIHSNPSTSTYFIDSHDSIDRNNLPYKDALRLILESGANMIIESVKDPLHNLSLLYEV